MSDTPETDANTYPAERWTNVDEWEHVKSVDAEFARRLERERDEAQALVAEMKQAIIWAKAEAKERLHRLDQAACERRTWLEAHEKMKRERDEARKELQIAVGLLSTHPQFSQDHPEKIMEMIKLEAAK